MTRTLGGFLRDESGNLTVEFLIWTPLLAAWFLISVTAFDAYKSRNDAAKAAYVLTDLIAAPDDNELSTAELQDFHQLAQRLLPRVAAGIQMRVSSIQFDEGDPDNDQDDTHTVLWSHVEGGLEERQGSDIPLALMPTMTSLDTVLLVELEVPYMPLFNSAGIEVTEWTYQLVTRPRFQTQIAKVD